jgi:hypothetical protein
MHATIVTIQDYAEIGWRRRAKYRAVHESLPGKYITQLYAVFLLTSYTH